MHAMFRNNINEWVAESATSRRVGEESGFPRARRSQDPRRDRSRIGCNHHRNVSRTSMAMPPIDSPDDIRRGNSSRPLALAIVGVMCMPSGCSVDGSPTATVDSRVGVPGSSIHQTDARGVALPFVTRSRTAGRQIMTEPPTNPAPL